MTIYFFAIYVNECLQIHIMETKDYFLTPGKSTHFVLKGISNLNNQDCISFLCPEGKNILSSVSKLAHTYSILVNFQKHICYSKSSSFNAKNFLLLEIVSLADSQHISILIPANPREAKTGQHSLESKGSILNV